MALLAFTLVFVFQNCSNNSFSGGSDADRPLAVDNPQETNDLRDPTPPLNQEDFGFGNVEGGHFDLDTATKVYADGNGKTNEHTHEYDDKHDTNIVDFFQMIGDKFDNIDETIPTNQSFYIIVANADLSPRVGLEINGTVHRLTDGPFGPFSLSGNSATLLNSLNALVATDAILNSGLVSTQTGCVRDNDFSQDGRYRNGALIFQAIHSDRMQNVDPVLGVAEDDNTLLWEATIFWHEDGGDCR